MTQTKILWFIPIIALLFSTAGCATTPKKKNLESQFQQSQMRITELEGEMQKKDEVIYGLEKKLSEVEKKQPAKDASSAQKTAKNIQLALKNAGLYTGPIDGKIGKETRNAVTEFQRQNGLVADGIVGKKTWAKLVKFL